MAGSNDEAAPRQRGGSNRKAQASTASSAKLTSNPTNTKGADKAQYSAVPNRAISDKRFAAMHFRLLSVVAKHDRLSLYRSNGKLGQGCWASNLTLAAAAGVHASNFSTALGELVEWGYIVIDRHPLKRVRVLRVIYGDLPVGKPANLPNDEQCRETTSTTVCSAGNNNEPNQSVVDDKYIPLKREDILLKQEEIRQKPENILQKHERYSEEPAPPQCGGGGWRALIADNPGGALALKERQLRTGDTLQPDERALIEGILLADFGDPISQQAERILEKWGGEIG